MSEVCFIYGLVDPVNDEIRYIGKTTDMKRRMKEHLSDGRSNATTHKINWIKSLLVQGLKPVVAILQETDDNSWQEAERTQIKLAKEKGHCLTNTTDGGAGYNSNSEVSEKISRSLKGIVFSKERNAKISVSLKGHHVSEETKRKIGVANKGNVGTVEGNKKISEKAKERGAFTQEHKDKIQVAKRGRRLTQEQIDNRKIVRLRNEELRLRSYEVGYI